MDSRLHTTTNHSMMSILGLPDSSTGVGKVRVENILDLSNERPRKRQRRNRTYFSEQSLRALELAFEINRYPDVVERTKIAETINEEETRVQIWFQNRRAKEKRKSGKGAKNNTPVQPHHDNATPIISPVTTLSAPSTVPYQDNVTQNTKFTISPVTSLPVPSPMLYQDNTTQSIKTNISPVTSLSVPAALSCQDNAILINTEFTAPVSSIPDPSSLSTTSPVSSNSDVISPVSHVITASREPANMVSNSTPEQVVPSSNSAYTQLYENQALTAYYWYLYNQHNMYSHFPFQFPLNYIPTSVNSASSFQQVPQSAVLDLSRKKQESPVWSPRPESPNCNMFFDWSSKVVSPIQASPEKRSQYSCTPKVYTSSPISTKYSSLCLPSVYKSAFSPISKLHDCETRPADRRSHVISSFSKEDTLSSDILVECDIITSRDIDVVLDLSNHSS